jgi:hypothetical protein
VSGGGADSFALAVAHAEGEIGVLDCLREVKPPLSPEAVITEFSDVLKSYKISKVTGDRYGGQFPVEQFEKCGIRYVASEDPKGAIYLNLLPMINSGRVKLLANNRLLSQFIGLERNTARGGRDSVDHARGAHDDIANAAAGALLYATTKRPQTWVGGIGVDGRVFYRPDLNGGRIAPGQQPATHFHTIRTQAEYEAWRKQQGLLSDVQPR